MSGGGGAMMVVWWSGGGVLMVVWWWRLRSVVKGYDGTKTMLVMTGKMPRENNFEYPRLFFLFVEAQESCADGSEIKFG